MKPAVQCLSECEDPALAGGKAANLGRLLRAGFNVPDGFVVTTAAGGNGVLPGPVRDRVIATWKKLGFGAVAVRSSASREDGMEASAAGQFDSFLEVDGEEDLLGAIGRCRDSFKNRRAEAYRIAMAAGSGRGEMAVLVQRFVAAEVSGVLFTSDPHEPDALRVEAARGTGEALVSGKVRPEVWRIDRATGVASPGEGRSDLCLDQTMLRQLWELGGSVAETLGGPQDIEWAIRDGELFVLQARPITTGHLGAARLARIEALKSGLRAGHGPWALHSLSEILRAPTELTWSVMERYLSPSGGFGRFYRKLGFSPSGGGASRRLASGIYTDLSAVPDMFGLPLRYDLVRIRQCPAAAGELPTISTGSLRERLKAWRTLRTARRRLRRANLEMFIAPFEQWCRDEKTRDLPALSADEWLPLWEARERRVFDVFAPEALHATAAAGAARAELRAFVVRHAWDEDPEALTQTLATDPQAPSSMSELQRLARGESSLPEWLEHWGHRGPDEMELASPRWRDQPARVEEMAAASNRPACERADGASFVERLAPGDARKLHRLVDRARRFLRLRETGRHWTMLGYDLLRDLALEAGRRLEVGPGIFHLTPAEIAQALREGSAPRNVIVARERERALDRAIFLPSVIDEAEIATIGELPAAPEGGELRGTGISAGTAAGRVRIVTDLETAGPVEAEEILVCMTLDPNLTPLFLRAGGLIVECGGSLSHAAIVAREMGLPALTLPGATALLREGMTVALDGSTGSVRLMEEGVETSGLQSLPGNLIPPSPSRREARARSLRHVFGGLWGLVLVAVFLLPHSWVKGPILDALDFGLWPLVIALGKPGAVAVIAALLALLMALFQLLLTDNAGLRLAKSAARLLASFDAEGLWGARADWMIDGVRRRLMAASWVAPAVLLGPLVLTCLWLSQRMDPAKANPSPGTDFSVVATVDGDLRQPVRLEVPAPLRLDPVTPAVQALPPVRQTLEKLLASMEADGAASPEKVADLRAYLARGVPPQKLLWKVVADGTSADVYPLSVRAPGRAPVAIGAVFGTGRPPAETMVQARGDVESVELVYPRAAAAAPFWQPFRWAGWSWDAGWLGLYLVVYLGAAAVFRRIFRLA